MRHRQFSNSFTRPGTDQHGSNHTPVEQSYFPPGRDVPPETGPFVGQMNHMSRGGVRSGSHRNLEGMGNEYPSSNASMEVQPFVPNFSGSPVDPYLHPSISENRSLAPVAPVGQVHSTNYNIPSMHHDLEAGLPNCTTANIGPLKRKRSDMSGSCERGGSSSFYNAGSSSSSSQMPREKPAVDCQSVPPYRSTLTIAGEDSPRNVRRRYRLDLEPNMTRTHVPTTHSSHFYQSMTHPPNYSAPVQHANIDTNGGQWNSSPCYAASSHRRVSPSDMGGLRHEMSQFHVGGSSADVGGCHRDPVFSRHPVSSSQNVHGPHAPTQANHSQRVQPTYGNGSRYSHYPHAGTSSTNGARALPENLSSRNSRHCSPGGWRSSYRSGRPRIAVERFQSVLDITESHDRMGQEAMMTMMDGESFNGSSRNISDQYRDLRLDIDSMSYEELLNLEERIGNVSTGLSEASMSKCLKEKVYGGSGQHNEEVSCPICLEEYKNGDKVGRMEKCGHDYHVGCIKKWLLMKKLCPICKTEYSNQEANP